MGVLSLTRPVAETETAEHIDWQSEARSWRRKAEQVENLASLGSFQLDFETGALTWSAGTYRIFGVDPQMQVTVEQALGYYTAEARERVERLLEAARLSGKPSDLTVPFHSETGKPGWVRVIAEIERSGSSTRLVGVLRDITSERDAEEQLRVQANQDTLTGLPNRRAFQAHLERVLAERAAGSALCLIDVDRFKGFNDAYGHAFGDSLLKEIAGRLSTVVRRPDVVARLGGDEFAVILHGVPSRAHLPRLTSPIVTAMRLPFLHDGVTSVPTISLGACMVGRSATADRVMKQADAALYSAKLNGRDQACVFRSSLAKGAGDNGRLLDEVRSGLARHQFEAHYQPIVDLRTRIVRGWEALVRWRHPRKGLLTPDRFLPALTDPQTSVAIDEFMLAESLRQMRQWLDAKVPVTCAGVNASEALLRKPDLFEIVTGLLNKYRLTPDRLKLEVLENAFVGSAPQEVADTIHRLAAIGVVSALDDFGTGYASLTHLKQFRVERIKLERAFIANLGMNGYDEAIVRCMIALGRDLNLRVTAEGIETREQLGVLQDMGCDCGQGYLFGRPMHPDDVPGFLSRWYESEANRILGDRPIGSSLRLIRPADRRPVSP